MNISKIFRLFLKPTADEKIPTDLQLDEKIKYVSDLLHKISPMLRHIVRTKIKLFFLYRWKYLIGRLVFLSLIIMLAYLLVVVFTPVRLTTHADARDTVIVSYPNDSSMNLRNYLLQIAYVESRYDPRAVKDSATQYWGLYQLGADARKLGGYGDIPKNVFLNHPEIQDLCMVNLLKAEKKYMQSYIDKYAGKIIDGILITESGILAMSHCGTGVTKSYLTNQTIPETDKTYGFHPRIYAKLGGYRLNLNKVRYSINDAN